MSTSDDVHMSISLSNMCYAGGKVRAAFGGGGGGGGGWTPFLTGDKQVLISWPHAVFGLIPAAQHYSTSFWLHCIKGIARASVRYWDMSG